MLYRIAQDQSVAFTVLGNICQACFDRVRHGVQANFLAVFEQLTADMGPVGFSEHALAQLSAPRTYQPRDAHDFALPQVDGHVVHYLAFGIQGMVHRPVLYLKRYGPDLYSLALGEAVGHLAPDHALYYAGFGEIVGLLVQCLYGLAVTYDSDVVRHVGDLVQFVGDNNGCYMTGILEQQKQVQQVLAVGFRKG